MLQIIIVKLTVDFMEHIINSSLKIRKRQESESKEKSKVFYLFFFPFIRCKVFYFKNEQKSTNMVKRAVTEVTLQIKEIWTKKKKIDSFYYFISKTSNQLSEKFDPKKKKNTKNLSCFIILYLRREIDLPRRCRLSRKAREYQRRRRRPDTLSPKLP